MKVSEGKNATKVPLPLLHLPLFKPHGPPLQLKDFAVAPQWDSQILGFSSQPEHKLRAASWKSHLSSLCPDFCVCKMEDIIRELEIMGEKSSYWSEMECFEHHF